MTTIKELKSLMVAYQEAKDFYNINRSTKSLNQASSAFKAMARAAADSLPALIEVAEAAADATNAHSVADNVAANKRLRAALEKFKEEANDHEA